MMLCFLSVRFSSRIEDDTFMLWKISYLWYTLIGMLIVLIFGTAVSFISGPQNPQKLDANLFLYGSKKFRSVSCVSYT